MAKKKDIEGEEKVDKRHTSRTGFRGWVLYRSEMDQCLRLSPGGFTKKYKHFAECPQRVMWPEMTDIDGACELISAIIDKNVAKLQIIADTYPDYDLGIADFLKTLIESNNARFPGGTRVIKSKSLRRGLRLDMEVSTDKHNVAHLRSVIRRGNKEIAAKTLAKKQLAKSIKQLTLEA